MFKLRRSTQVILFILTAAYGRDSSAQPSQSIPRSEQPVVQDNEAEAECTFKAGAHAADTLGRDAVAALQANIDTFVLVMQENRSFDHYFSKLPEYGQPDVDVAGSTAPDERGPAIERAHLTNYCVKSPVHSWNSQHHGYNDGKMDGFAVASDPEGERALGYLDGEDLPFYYALANTYGISDRHFCSVLGPTIPNRLFLYTGTSFGRIANIPALDAGGATIFRALEKAGIDWRIYTDSGVAALEVTFINTIARFPRHIASIAQFARDAKAGRLPPVSFLDPGHFDGERQLDEHPPANHQYGQHLLHQQFTALTQSPQWSRAAFIMTYDENGGFYDHVPPPRACAPDSRLPRLGSHDYPGSFDRYGPRVPLLVASPWSKPHYVSHAITDHASVLRLLEARFDLPAFTARDANASALLDFFDFSSEPRFSVAPQLPEPEVRVNACHSTAR